MGFRYLPPVQTLQRNYRNGIISLKTSKRNHFDSARILYRTAVFYVWKSFRNDSYPQRLNMVLINSFYQNHKLYVFTTNLEIEWLVVIYSNRYFFRQIKTNSRCSVLNTALQRLHNHFRYCIYIYIKATCVPIIPIFWSSIVCHQTRHFGIP